WNTRESHALGSPLHFAERQIIQPQQQGTERDKQSENEQRGEYGRASEGRRGDQELAGEDPERRQAGDGRDSSNQHPAQDRMRHGQPAHADKTLSSLDLRDVSDRKE